MGQVYLAVQAANSVPFQLSSFFLSCVLGAEICARDQSVSAPSKNAGALGHSRDPAHASWKVRMRVCLPAPLVKLHGRNCCNSVICFHADTQQPCLDILTCFLFHVVLGIQRILSSIIFGYFFSINVTDLLLEYKTLNCSNLKKTAIFVSIKLHLL